MLSEIDGLFRDLWTYLVKFPEGQNLTCLFLSDHGFSTIAETVDPGERLVTAGLKDSSSSTEVVVGAGNIYLTTPESRGRCREILAFLMAEPWLGRDRIPSAPSGGLGRRAGSHANRGGS